MKLDPALHPVLLELAQTERALKASPGAVVTPEQKELDTLIDEKKALRRAADSAQMAVDDMEIEILRIQEDERKLRRRERDDREQLSAELDEDKRRDLEHDRYAAKSRIADLMSELMEAHNEIHPLRNNAEVHGAKLTEVERQIEAAQRAADSANEAAAHMEHPEDHIAKLRAQLPADAVATYDEKKKESDVGAAEFNGRACGSCFLVMTPGERGRVNKSPADELPECPNCNTYLVRTVNQ